MINKIYELYALLFAKPKFNKLNKFLLNLALRGLGILNFNTEVLRGEFIWIKKYLNSLTSEPLIIDVGANVGEYTKFCKKVKPDSTVIAIEANPKTYEKLINNLSNLNNVYVFNYAVSNKNDEKVKIYDYFNNDSSTHASLYRKVIEDIHNSTSTFHITKTITLDKLMENFNDKNVDLLKIDVEGNEFNVLLGAANMLSKKRIKVIQFEFNEMNIISKVTFKDFWDLLSSNYNLYRLLPYGRLLYLGRVYSPIYHEIYHYQNIVAILKSINV